MTKPKVSPYQWVNVEGCAAVVCQVYDKDPNGIEVVFMDKGRGKAVNKSAHWHEDRWLFNDRSYGGNADDNPRLASFVATLRAGERHQSKA